MTFPSAITPPAAKKRPEKITQLGRSRTDEYRWLKDENWQAVMKDTAKLNPDIRAYLEAENTYTQQVLKSGQELSETIFEEMKNRLEPEESDVPVPDGAFAYYHRFRKGDQHGIYARRSVNTVTRKPSGNEEILLDADALAAKTPGFFDLGTFEHSQDHSKIAFSIDNKGAENYEIFIADIGKTPVSTGVTNSTGGLEWAADHATIFWTERDENQRPFAVYAKMVTQPGSEARLIYKENDPGFFVSVSGSDSREFIHISSHDHTTTELRIVRADAPFEKPMVFSRRKTGREYSVHKHGQYFYILTNSGGATDFQIMRQKISGGNWEPFIPHKSGTLILGLEAYKNFLVWLVRENALPRIIIQDMRSGLAHDIAFDEDAYGLGLMGGYEYDTPWLRFSYASPTTPSQIFDYNMDTRARVLRKTQTVPSGHNQEDYKAERINITARDGADIPVTLLSRAGTKKNESAPLLLYGYGSYGITISASFRTTILSLVDRGFTYAIAHVRGGMANGYQWYLDGKLEKKTNSFNDYVDVGRELCERGYTSPGRIVAHGGSAGGLLVGAALNQAPSLFGAVIAAVPFVDVLNTMSDDTLPLTPPEWPEWGNPLIDADAYDQIAAYSPYDNIKPGFYPPMLITGGLTDPRVTYWEPAKWAARIRDNQRGNSPILLKINMEAGHQGEAGRYDSLKETALEYAFAVTAMQT